MRAGHARQQPWWPPCGGCFPPPAPGRRWAKIPSGPGRMPNVPRTSTGRTPRVRAQEPPACNSCCCWGWGVAAGWASVGRSGESTHPTHTPLHAHREDPGGLRLLPAEGLGRILLRPQRRWGASWLQNCKCASGAARSWRRAEHSSRAGPCKRSPPRLACLANSRSGFSTLHDHSACSLYCLPAAGSTWGDAEGAARAYWSATKGEGSHWAAVELRPWSQAASASRLHRCVQLSLIKGERGACCARPPPPQRTAG